jgi:hypothetical protein
MSQTNKNVQLILLGGLLASALLAVGVGLGMGLSPERRSDVDLLKLHASASSTGKTVSLATASIGNGSEALYILDHLNVNLQCWGVEKKAWMQIW